MSHPYSGHMWTYSREVDI